MTDYGINKKLTLSLATGYHLNKSLSLKGEDSSATTSGMGDIIIFPRYDIYNETNGNIRTEVTLGLGVNYLLVLIPILPKQYQVFGT